MSCSVIIGVFVKLDIIIISGTGTDEDGKRGGRE